MKIKQAGPQVLGKIPKVFFHRVFYQKVFSPFGFGEDASFFTKGFFGGYPFFTKLFLLGVPGIFAPQPCEIRTEQNGREKVWKKIFVGIWRVRVRPPNLGTFSGMRKISKHEFSKIR